jgi:uncharacterized repeat protein (TIGR01451 family)
VTISRNPRNSPSGPAPAIRFAAIPVVLLSVHGASVAAVSSSSPTARATATAPAARATAVSSTRKAKAASPTAKGKAASPTAAAHLPRVPGLRISIGDGRNTAQAGDRLTYTILVQNSGAHRSPPLKITQTMPSGLRFISASGHGVVKAGSVTWHADLPAGGKDTFSLQAQVTRSAARQSRLAAVACAALAGSRTPIVCAAHLDRLPGALAAAPARRAATPAARTLPSYTVGVLAVLAAAVLAVLTALRVRVRVRRRRAG